MHKIYLSVCAVYDFFFNPSASFWSCSVFKMNRWIPFFHEPFLEAIASLEITFSLTRSVTQSGSFLLLCIFLKNQIPGKSQVYLRHMSVISQTNLRGIWGKSPADLMQIAGISQTYLFKPFLNIFLNFLPPFWTIFQSFLEIFSTHPQHFQISISIALQSCQFMLVCCVFALTYNTPWFLVG